VPELPEVETVVRELRPQVVQRRILSVQAGTKSLRRPWAAEWTQQLTGRRVREVRRRGKWIILALQGEMHLVVHLGMTGQLKVTPAEQPLEPHTHLVFGLGNGEWQLRFRDIRRFGSATLFSDGAAVERFFEESRLGPEPFALDPRVWREQLARTRRCLKAVLLDQRVVAGVGNIYADESLFEARLHPTRLATGLISAEAGRLRRAICTVLERAIQKRGSSIRDYVGGSGLGGNYQHEFRVYGRTGEPCPRCCKLIECIRLAGRATHYCPRCQRRKEEG
jgi:formamidopyrimidine-DNA glycosylase